MEFYERVSGTRKRLACVRPGDVAFDSPRVSSHPAALTACGVGFATLSLLLYAPVFACPTTSNVSSIAESLCCLFASGLRANNARASRAQQAGFSSYPQVGPQFPLTRGPLFTPFLFIAAYFGIFFAYFFALALKYTSSPAAALTAGFTPFTIFLLLASLVALLCAGFLGIVSTETGGVTSSVPGGPYAD